MDVLPDVELGPIGDREDADALPLLDLRVVEVPELGPLVLRIPAVVFVPEGKHPLLGPRLLLVAAGPAEGGVEAVFVEGLPQALRLHDVGVDLAAVREGVDPLGPPLLVDMDDELEAELLGDVLVAELVHVAELPRRVDVHEREGGLGRKEGLLREAHHDGRVLADRVKHDRVFKLGGHLADDVDALGLELTEMGEVVGGHGLQRAGSGDVSAGSSAADWPL